MAPVINGLNKHDEFASTVCATAQHRGLLDSALDTFGIKPDFDLDLMENDQSPTEVLARVVEQVGLVIEKVQPDWLLVQGDTTTALGSALAGSYARCLIGHVEAGLRSHDRFAPFPEELNRCVIAGLASAHFAPTRTAANNLYAEGLDPKTVLITGNTVIDALREVQLRPPSRYVQDLLGPANSDSVVLVTMHRRENFGERLERLVRAVASIVDANPNVRLICPVHPNPSVSEPFNRILGGNDRVRIVNPLHYPDLVTIMQRCRFIITDSGGIQEEAPALGIPVLVTRNVTERPEALNAGAVRLVGTDASLLVALSNELLNENGLHQSMSKPVSPYGDGQASRRILAYLLGLPTVEFAGT
jgi:UDP-N-acetylglucosamine 2-epimerase